MGRDGLGALVLEGDDIRNLGIDLSELKHIKDLKTPFFWGLKCVQLDSSHKTISKYLQKEAEKVDADVIYVVDYFETFGRVFSSTSLFYSLYKYRETQ